MFSKVKIKEILESRGFKIDNEGNTYDSYKINLGNEWDVSVFCPFVGDMFKGSIDKENYNAVSMSLFECIGTDYKFRSAEALDENIDKVLKTLKSNSDNDDILKCEKCGVRYVQPKEPPVGKKWKPFLSCSGMIIKGSGKNKGIICDGTSKKLPAVVVL